MNNRVIIDVQSISYTYPSASKQTLSDCSLTVHKGELISILGPNGAGKSTLLNCACGLLVPQTGSVYLNGQDIRKMTQRNIAKVIGYVQQYQDSAFAYSVFDYVLMGRASSIDMFQRPNAEDRIRVSETLERMGIAYLADASITEISGGERQQAAIARAIVQDPEVVFFDEPTAHLDYGNQVRALKIINDLREQGFAVVMTTHTPDHCIMLGGKVAILNKRGTLLFGDSNTLITEELLREVYHTNLRVVYVDEAGRNVCLPENIR